MCSTAERDMFLDSLELPVLNKQNKIMIEDITEKELKITKRQLKLNKSLGSNGYSRMVGVNVSDASYIQLGFKEGTDTSREGSSNHTDQYQSKHKIMYIQYIISHIQKNKIPAVVISNDAGKAFDSVNWSFL